MAAEQDEVVEIGGFAVPPWPDVVGLGFAGWFFAAGEGATTVAQDQCLAAGSGGESAFAAEVEDLAIATEDCGEDPCLAGESTGFGDGDGFAGGEQFRPAVPLLEGVESGSAWAPARPGRGWRPERVQVFGVQVFGSDTSR